MHHLIPGHRNSDSGTKFFGLTRHSSRKSDPPPKDSLQLGKEKSSDFAKHVEDEKHFIAQWEEDKRPLEPAEVASDPRKKRVGHSSKYLSCQDFELVKTLGTGVLQDLGRTLWACANREHCRHIRKSLARKISEASKGGCEQGFCVEDTTKSKRYDLASRCSTDLLTACLHSRAFKASRARPQ